jgi:hypothetical protein
MTANAFPAQPRQLCERPQWIKPRLMLKMGYARNQPIAVLVQDSPVYPH